MSIIVDSTGVPAPQPQQSETPSSPAGPRRVAANRRNALKSTGPTTGAGKERVRKNALKHGLFARILPRRDLPFLIDHREYDALIEELKEDFQPRTQIEMTLVETLAFDLMRMRHIYTMENAVLERQRPPDQEVNKWRGEIERERRGRSMEDLQSDRELVESLGRTIRAGKRPSFKGTQAQRLAELLEECFSGPVRQMEWLRKEIEEVQAHPPPPEKQGAHQQHLGELAESLKQCEAWVKERGLEAHGCATPAILKEMIQGRRPIPPDRTALWSGTVGLVMSNVSGPIRMIKGFEGKLASLRDAYLLSMLDNSPQLDRLGRYETMVRRNIDRTLNQLQSIRHEIMSDTQWVCSENESAG